MRFVKIKTRKSGETKITKVVLDTNKIAFVDETGRIVLDNNHEFWVYGGYGKKVQEIIAAQAFRRLCDFEFYYWGYK